MAKQTVTALYDSREYANNAALQLRQAGVPDVTVSPEDATTGSSTAERPATGFWASLEAMFGDTEDHGTYAEGLRRGGILLTAHVDDAKLDDAITILEQHGSVDLDERETSWRGEGWTGGSALGIGAVGAAGGGTSRVQTAIDAASSTATAQTATTGTALRSDPVMPAGAAAGSATRTGAADEKLQVVEERLSVGKRAVNRGRVRIHSYVVETPVTERVSLRNETVTVDRRPVDRALAPGELGAAAFTDRVIEAEEVGEEAVVGKTARVVEEIGISKTAEDRVQTISDSVRSTKVEVEDARAVGGATGVPGGSATSARENMEVVGSDGTHVGVIDHIEQTSIKLKKNDSSASGRHHILPLDLIGAVTTKVTLTVTAAEAMRRWTVA